MLLILGLVSSNLFAKEPVHEFVNGLRQLGLHDWALEYLSRIEKSPRLTDEKVRKSISYERGKTLIEKSRQTVSSEERSVILSEARKLLSAYAKSNPDSAEAVQAQAQLGSLLIEQGVNTVRQAKLEKRDSQKEFLLKTARKHFKDAREILALVEQFYQHELEILRTGKHPAPQATHKHLRQEYRSRIAQTLLSQGRARYEQAHTHQTGSTKNKTDLTLASQELGKLFENYHQWSAGHYGHFLEGLCYQELGKTKQAIQCFNDLLGLPNNSSINRLLITKSHLARLVSFTAQKNHASINGEISSWLKESLSKRHNSSPDLLELRFRFSESLRDQIEKSKGKKRSKEKLRREMLSQLKQVAKEPGKFRGMARMALVKEGALTEKEPTDFNSAFESGILALETMKSSQDVIQIAEENNPDIVADLEQAVFANRQKAIKYFKLALQFVDKKKTPLKKINEARYRLTYLYWLEKNYPLAASAGYFLATKHSESPYAASAARIALACYEQLYHKIRNNGGTHEDAKREAKQLEKLAEYIITRWSGSKDAEKSFSLLLNFAIKNNQIEKAIKLLQTLSEKDQKNYSLQIGNVLYGQYLKGRASTETPELEAKHKKALLYLKKGHLFAIQKKTINSSSVTAGLYLAIDALAARRSSEAITILTQKTIGPLTLAKKNHPTTEHPGLKIGIYKTALRAYISGVPPATNKALAIVPLLEKAITKSGRSDSKELVQIYVGISSLLQKKIEELKATKKTENLASLTAAFNKFLNKITSHKESASWGTKSWLASTYYRMALTGGTSPKALAKKSTQKNLQQSFEICESLLAAAKKDPSIVPTPLSIAIVKLQFGKCLTAQGKYKQAISIFSQLLKEKENRLDVQKNAADAYLAWGQNQDPRRLTLAIFGGQKLRSTGKNRIWGWLKISKIIRLQSLKNPKYKPLYFEASYKVAFARYLIGVNSSETTKVLSNVSKAQRMIKALYRSDPELGGKTEYAKFNRLMKEIQKKLGKKQPEVLGLAAFENASK